jgi:transposase
MSNVLKVSHQEAVRSLHAKNWSQRRIARELGIHRKTVWRYTQKLAAKCTISTPGSDTASAAKCTISTSGSETASEPKCTISTSGVAGRRSDCDPFAGVILSKLGLGLSAQRIFQDLRAETGFEGSYQSVKRFVRRVQATHPERVWRMECEPGEEMQVDFGLGAMIEQENGHARRSWVFRVVLSYSRKGYSEAVFRQDTETFLRCLENAVRHFGGVPLVLNIDNLKAAVLQADWFDPEINPKLAEFCRHYGIHVTPCRAATPQHKGKVERGVAYVRQNGLKGHRFGSLAQENLFLSQWEEKIADQRIHGTTRKQVAACFEEERPHLQPLPPSLFPAYQEARRSVHQDGYVAVAKAYYEAPPEYIGHQVWVRWDSRCVRIFNDRMEQVQMHTRLEPGKFSRVLGAGGFSGSILSNCRRWRERAALLGDHCEQWAGKAIELRGPQALRSIMGLCNLIRHHSAATIDHACQRAIAAGAYGFKDVRRLLSENKVQTNFAFAEKHPLIRDLGTYSEFLRAATG